MTTRLIAAAATLCCIISATAAAPHTSLPDPADPSTWGLAPPLELVAASTDNEDAVAKVRGRRKIRRAQAAAATNAAAAAPSAIGERGINPPDPADAFAQVRARHQIRSALAAAATNAPAAATAPTKSKTMRRVTGEMVAAIETDRAGNKTAKIIHADGTTEIRPLKVLYTARVKPPAAPASRELPVDGSHAAAAAAGAAAAAAAALAAKKLRRP